MLFKVKVELFLEPALEDTNASSILQFTRGIQNNNDEVEVTGLMEQKTANRQLKPQTSCCLLCSVGFVNRRLLEMVEKTPLFRSPRVILDSADSASSDRVATASLTVLAMNLGCLMTPLNVCACVCVCLCVCLLCVCVCVCVCVFERGEQSWRMHKVIVDKWA